MDLVEYARQILLGTTFEDKLLSMKHIEKYAPPATSMELTVPGRPKHMHFSELRTPFPKQKNFYNKLERAKALHFFANHELLAIEIMALMLVRFDLNETLQRDLAYVITEEQKHLRLYCTRMEQLGIGFGELPLNDFFWKHALNVKNIQEYFAMMALTFESANLDFGIYYEKVFRNVEDNETADILKIVYEDEIGHVALGVNTLQQYNPTKDLWEYYCSLLPKDFGPARAKGMQFDRAGRERAGLPADFIDKIENYRSEHRVTQRKTWSKE